MLPAALQGLAAYRQFIPFTTALIPGKPGRLNKLPLDFRTLAVPVPGIGASSPEIWLSYEEAAAIARVTNDPSQPTGVGFVLTPEAGFCCVDLDSCRLPDGSWAPIEHVIVDQWFPGAGVETSLSGKGRHVFFRGKPPEGHRTRCGQWGLEFYSRDRFIALTGSETAGDCTLEIDAPRLEQFVASYFAGPVGAGSTDFWQVGPSSTWVGYENDDDLIRYASTTNRPVTAEMAFGKGGAVAGPVSFLDLWEAREEALAKFPSRSEADFAFAQELAYHAGRDCPRIERLMRRSKLAREKWNTNAGYLRSTIGAAAGGKIAVLILKQKLPPVVQQPPPIEGAPWVMPVIGWAGTVVPYSLFQQFFRGYRYACAPRLIVDPRGVQLGPMQFNDLHKGMRFGMAPDNSKEGKEPWDAAMVALRAGNMVYDDIVYHYDKPFLAEVHEDGQRKLNVAKLPEVKRVRGNWRPFFRQLMKMMGGGQAGRDRRRILLLWATHAVQHRGYLTGWAPVIQGIPGNGKTTFVNMVQRAVGESATFSMNVHKVAKEGHIGFNAFIEHSLLVEINEPAIGGSAYASRAALEALKPYLTDRYVTIEGKGRDQYRARNHVSWIATTNYKNGIPITTGERRYAPLYTMQQSPDALPALGQEEYWRWSEIEENQWAVNEFLLNLKIVRAPACDSTWQPGRAPITPDTVEAIGEGLSEVASEIADLIASGEAGFRGGWVSSIAVTTKLPKVNTRRVASAMNELGYIRHPGLKEGRVNDPIDSIGCPDSGRKPSLYIHRSDVALARVIDPRRAYEAMQAGVPPPPSS